MAEKYDSKNGYNSSDFKRNAPQDANIKNDQDGEDNPIINEKAGEYMRELLSEKIKLNNAKFPIITKLIDQEVTKVQASGRIPGKDSKYLDVFRDKPTKVTVKVLVPVKEHPKFNFVGKLLGPKGNTMKHLQEETMCKMAVLGRGSMRDRQKEEELRTSLDPKYAHLTDELHVEISALAPPAEAHARIAYALAEVKKYLLPDTNDMIWQTQMRDIERGDFPAGPRGPGGFNCTATPRSFSFEPSSSAAPAGAPRGGRPPPRMAPAPPMQRSMPPKNKVISILDRARSAMETYPYDDVYAQPPEPPIRGPVRGAAPEPDYYYERSHDRYGYEDEGGYGGYKDDNRDYKTARAVGTRRPNPMHAQQQHHAPRHYARPEPYARPPK